ncbi:hypothetical protein CBOM_07039 [Ceraceosorus bombacis]|uniref:Uncharacterized protein n=1 Tax=Ceraceosorus bombacis TaxID=401625 RepID=A0A0P1BKV0_9BASI|nr:hypothetical protein CBOM_07039 [Ceraceosorus bombacis]
MDLLNSYFRNTTAILPSSFVVLNGDFKQPGAQLSFVPGATVDQLAQRTYILHFSESPRGGHGKPEDRKAVNAPADAHPLFRGAFDRYWTLEEQLCAPDIASGGAKSNADVSTPSAKF